MTSLLVWHPIWTVGPYRELPVCNHAGQTANYHTRSERPWGYFNIVYSQDGNTGTDLTLLAVLPNIKSFFVQLIALKVFEGFLEIIRT
jgi:hypothetical protein